MNHLESLYDNNQNENFNNKLESKEDFFKLKKNLYLLLIFIYIQIMK